MSVCKLCHLQSLRLFSFGKAHAVNTTKQLLSFQTVWSLRSMSSKPVNLSSQLPSSSVLGHLDITSKSSRQQVMADASVLEIRDISSTVKFLDLQVHDKDVSFQAGQWIDMFIPGVETVGGFSIVSPPSLLSTTGRMHLGIKYSEHPPAHWVHTKCAVGSEVKLRVGGDFYYDPEVPSRDILLLAGGVGVNPLISILSHYAYLCGRRGGEGSKALLLLAAASPEDLLFKEEIEGLCGESGGKIRAEYFMSDTPADPDVSYPRNVHFSRLESAAVSEGLKSLGKDAQVFICGPRTMLEDMEQYVLDYGLPSGNIHFEKWW